jgi:methionyl aminopeptidase
MDRFTIKTPEEIKIMAEGGKMLGEIRDSVASAVRPGITSEELENLACGLIEKTSGQASFKMVKGYKHATCISINDVVVHGIPDREVIGEGDIVGVDVGLFYRGFHTDTAVTVGTGKIGPENQTFLDTGRRALKEALLQARQGKRIWDISRVIQECVEKSGYSAVTALTGHGIGKNLHEEPAIPCFAIGRPENSAKIVEGMVLAIEVMYNKGRPEVVYKNEDGWTISTVDGKISGLFEHTVAVTKNGPVVLTQ